MSLIYIHKLDVGHMQNNFLPFMRLAVVFFIVAVVELLHLRYASQNEYAFY